MAKLIMIIIIAFILTYVIIIPFNGIIPKLWTFDGDVTFALLFIAITTLFITKEK